MIFRDGILDGKVALVTGGGTGIGETISLSLAAAGADVAVCSRDEAHLHGVAKEISDLGRRSVARPCDVRDADGVEAVVQTVESELGGLDILVNAAAGNFLCPAAELSPNGFRSVVEIDLVGSFVCSRAAYPRLKARGGGSIIHITATLDYQGLPLQVHAGSAKAGIDAMTRHLGSEWGPDNIRVTAVAPGPIGDTEGMRRLGGGQEAAIVAGTPLGRMGRRDEIAQMVVYLASPAGDWITGTTFTVDGGQRLKAKSWV